MALTKLWTIAYRDLMRNRRRTLFTMLAVALGLALLVLLNGWIAGILEGSLQISIRYQTGHIQLRAPSYESDQLSLLWKDLVDEPEALAAAADSDSVMAASPVLWASVILSTNEDTAGLRLYGVEPESKLYDPFRAALTTGEFLTADDRDGVVIGQKLANELGIDVGQKINLAIVNADGQPDEALFTVRGLFSTGIFAYDEGAVFMPLAKARAFGGTGDRASAVVILLNDQEATDAVAAGLANRGADVLTWRDLNELLLMTVQTGMSFYYILDFIVILIVAVIIANTLLMAVFERVREMGILAALGMKARQIRLMFLLEASILGLVGILAGLVLGSLGVAYLANVGVNIGDIGAAAGGVTMGSVVYGRFVPSTFLGLSVATFIIILLASLYPAWYASKLEPVQALHAL
ncbi:MAG: ABC transporter permease [Caldilineales bacterium]|nr:ABC transporter permease [Caldilineales bacterium]